MQITVGDRSVNLATGGVPLGDDDRPLVLLVHGAGMDRSVWSQQTRFLAHHGYRAAAVDLPGHGETDGPTMTTIDGMGTWVAEVAEHLGPPAHLVGHSMGSLIVLAAAAAHPEVVASAVLIGVAANMPVHPDLQGAADDDDRSCGRFRRCCDRQESRASADVAAAAQASSEVDARRPGVSHGGGSSGD